jgi:HEAT repeat protein
MPLFGPPDVAKLEAKRDVKGLIKALAYQKDAEVRHAAADALGKIADAGAVEPLIVAVSDHRPEVQRAAVSALGKLGVDRAVQLLIAALASADYQATREAAAEALGKIGDATAIRPLIAVLCDQDRNYSDRSALSVLAGIALGNFGAAAVPVVVAALADTDARVRRHAADVLGEIGDARVVKPLTVALKDQGSDVRRFCHRGARPPQRRLRGLLGLAGERGRYLCPGVPGGGNAARLCPERGVGRQDSSCACCTQGGT